MKRQSIVHWIIIIIFSLSLFLSPEKTNAAATPYIAKSDQPLEFTVDNHTALGGDGVTYYSSKFSLTPKSIDFTSLGIDPLTVRSATLTSSMGTAVCTNTSCTFSQVNGTPVAVNASTTDETNKGYFDWWRNQSGSYHSNWWSFDLPNGQCSNGATTCYSITGGEQGYFNNGQNIAVAPRDFPGDYSYPTKNWSADGSQLIYTAANGSNLSYNYVSLNKANILLVDSKQFVVDYPVSVVPDSNGIAKFDADVGPFDGSKADFDPLGNDPLGYSFPYGFIFKFTGNTYTYSGKWTLTITPIETDKPDLSVPSLTGSACTVVGQQGTFKYIITNGGGVDVSSAFKVKVMADGTEIITHSYNSGIASKETKTGTFTYTFSAAGTKTFTVWVDSNKDIDEGTEGGEDNNTNSVAFEAKTSCNSTPEPPADLVITGDFTIVKPTIIFKDDEILRPENIKVSGGTNNCKYDSHSFWFKQGSNTFAPRSVSPETADYWLSYDSYYKTYGGGIVTGTVTVYMKINTTCGVTKEIGPKTFQIVPDPNNHPPQLEIAWYVGNAEVEKVTQGSNVNLRVKIEKDQDKNDDLTRTWFFEDSNSSWINNLPSTYNWSTPYNQTQYINISADVQGSHKVCAVTTDTNGAKSNTACAYLDVVGPEPIPVINGAATVKELRKMNPVLDANSSFSPVPGVSIDHARDEWTNTAVWDDGTTSSWSGTKDTYNKPGKVTVMLDVFDSTGKKSVDPDTHTIIVTPDVPPIIDFMYIDTTTRMPRVFQNKSYSPDGDNIVMYLVTYGYDRYNNGSCTPTETIINANNNTFTFSPNRVGNYCFRVYAKEDYGKEASKDYMVQVINDNPDVTFTVTGVATEPSPVNVVNFTPSTLVGWTNTSLDKPSMANTWFTAGSDVLMSSRKNGVSPFSYPSGSLGTLYGTVQTPAGCSGTSSEFVQYLGNGYFIDRCYISYTNRPLYLVSAGSAPVSLGVSAYVGDGKSFYRMTTREATNDFVIEIIYTYQSYTDVYDYSNDWYRFDLSSLRSGSVVRKASGKYTAGSRAGNNNGYASGSMALFSDGSKVFGSSTNKSHTTSVGTVGLNFAQDYKEINLTTRTIKSYNYNNLTTPYKTETYTSIPAVSQQHEEYGYTYGMDASEISIGLYDLYLNRSNVVINDYGDYFYSDGTNTYKFDRVTGMPSAVSSAGTTYSLNAAAGDYGQSGWGQYTSVSYYTTTCDDGDGNYYSCTFPKTNYYLGDAIAKSGGNLMTTYDSGYVDAAQPAAVDVIKRLGYIKSFPMEEGKYYTPTGSIYTYTPESAQTPYTNEAVTLGQLMNTSSQQVINGTIAWSAKYHHFDHVFVGSGMSFRIQNYQNMYRLEATKDTLSLLKIVNGRKTVLKSVNRIMQNESWVPYKIQLSGTHIKVYENGGLLIDMYDGTFANGTMGPFSTADNTEFKGVSFIWSSADSSFETPGVAIVDTAVTYDTTYTDPESDPRLDPSTQWTYHHVDTTKFLDAGDGKSGLSSLNGQTVTNPVLTFDKVGVYQVDYRVPDDPHPDHRIVYGDYTFAAYSKYSDWYTQYLIVHRRPLSNFTLGTDSNQLVTWIDYSYDPDRCYNSGNCMSGYGTSHGIFKKKFYYITPNGDKVDGKLVRPTQYGIYTVAMAVADEYNAWSDWYIQTIDICSTCTVAPNNPPTVTLTFPSGSYASPSPVSLMPTIYWNQADPDPGTIYSTFDLNVKDEWGGCVECVTNKLMDTPNTSWAWTMDNSLTMGQKYQAQVRISDGEAWSGWSNIGWMATNSPPAAFMSFPYGTQMNPAMVNTLRPMLQWVQSDPDPGAIFKYYQLQITSEDNTVMILDSGKLPQNTSATGNQWLVTSDMPAGQKLRVRVKVWDQYGAESPWSSQAWMQINRPPVADFDWTPKPAVEGDALKLLNRSTDSDGDLLTYHWAVTGPGYTAPASFTTTDAWIPAEITDGHPGDYVVTLTVTDPYGASDSITRVVPIGDLSLEGVVKHTLQWEEKRQAYNELKTGDKERPRSADIFWSGEAFVLEAGTNQPAALVSVQMSMTNLQTQLTAADNGAMRWLGQLGREDFEQLPNGSYTFHFAAIWPNGHQETVDRIVIVQDPWTDYTSSVRKH